MSAPVDIDGVERGLRMRAFLAVESLLRMLRTAVDAFGDLDSAMIYLTVVAASAGAGARDPEFRAVFDTAPLPDEAFRPVSRRAISLATGLPRETVRRKIARLVAEGHLIEEADGVRAPSNTIMRRDNLAFARDLIRELERGAAIVGRAT
jgi:hypothetical protein